MRPIVVAAAVLLVVCGRAHAFRTASDVLFPGEERVTWSPSATTYSIANAPSGLVLSSVELAVAQSVASWEQPCSAMRLTYAEQGGAAAHDDHRNTLEWIQHGWSDLGLSADVSGATDVLYQRIDDRWTIVEADILFNAQERGWTTTGQENLRDVQSVVTHELGHFFGLAHVCATAPQGDAPLCVSDPIYETSVMHPLYRGTDGHSLSADDAAGICYLYSVSECAADAECETGRACIGGTCRPFCERNGCDRGFDCSERGCLMPACAACDGTPDPCPLECGGTGQDLGGPCRSGSDCASGVCANAIYCSSVCGAGTSCAAGWECTEGQCTPTLGLFGDACDLPTDCHSGLCLDRDNSRSCTSSCARADDCSIGAECVAVEGRRVCVTRLPSSCAAGVPLPRAREGGLAAGLVIAICVARRRKR